MLKRLKIVIIVVILVVAGVASFSYERYLQQHKTLPYVTSDNTVANETLKEPFVQFDGQNGTEYNYNATTQFTYRNVTSNLTIQVKYVYPFLNSACGPNGAVYVLFTIEVFGNITKKLHVTSLSLTLSDYGNYSNSYVKGFLMIAYPLFIYNATPVSGLRITAVGDLSAYGNFNITASYRLNDTVNTAGYSSFGISTASGDNSQLYLYLPPHASSTGTHIVRFIATLGGLADPVSVTINLLLVDTS